MSQDKTTADDPRNWATQSHQETLRLLIHSDTSPSLYSHEVAALQAAIEALDQLEGKKTSLTSSPAARPPAAP